MAHQIRVSDGKVNGPEEKLAFTFQRITYTAFLMQTDFSVYISHLALFCRTLCRDCFVLHIFCYVYRLLPWGKSKVK